MTDIFFSYSSADRERVRPIRDALAEQGFEVFWDQQVPTGIDWDSWIRQHLAKSKCVMAFWSATSVSSDNVRHEATVAKQQGKLISVLLEPLTAEQFPMGLYAQQAANLSGWSGDYSHDEWRKFRREFEAKLTPLWVRRQIDELEAELVGERARREGAERRDRVLQAQIVKEAEAQQDLKRDRDKALDEVAALEATVEKLTRAGADATAREVEAERRDRALQAQIAKSAEAYQDLKRDRDKVLDEVAALKTNVEELTQARADAKEKQTETQQALTRERNKALDEVTTLKAMVEESTRARADANAQVIDLSQRLRNVRKSKAQEIARSIGAAFPPLVIAATVATLGFWTYQLIWSGPRSPLAVTSEMPEAERQRLAAIKEEEQRQAKADVEAKLKAAEVEQQRLKEEAQRQAKAAADAEAKRKTAEVEQQRLKEEVQRQAKELAAIAATKKPDIAVAPSASPAPTSSTGLFTIQANTEASGSWSTLTVSSYTPSSRANCEESCAREPSCNAFTYNKDNQRCYRFSGAFSLAPNTTYESGIRNDQTNQNSQPSANFKSGGQSANISGPTVTTGVFTIRNGTEATGYPSGQVVHAASITDCKEICARASNCNIFTYDKNRGMCYSYTRADFKSNEQYDSGVRIGQQTNPRSDINTAPPASPAMPTSSTGPFEIRANTEASGVSGYPAEGSASVASREACEQSCTRLPTCEIFTYNKSTRRCYRYSRADFKANEVYDSGVRIGQTNPSFEIRANTEAAGSAYYTSVDGASMDECEEGCARESKCKIFTYNKSIGRCYRYMRADFKANGQYDSGVRIEHTNPSSGIEITAPASPATPASASGLFTIQANTEGLGATYSSVFSSSTRAECEESCARDRACKAFTYNKKYQLCYRFSGVFSLSANTAYDSGVRNDQTK
jgi:hypothetical protein